MTRVSLVECKWIARGASPKCAHDGRCHLRSLGGHLLLIFYSRSHRGLGGLQVCIPGFGGGRACARLCLCVFVCAYRETPKWLAIVNTIICKAEIGEFGRASWWLCGPLVSSVAKEAGLVCRAGHWELWWLPPYG